MLLRSEARPAEIMLWQRRALTFAVLVMECCWLSLWFLALAPGAGSLPTSASAGFVLANLVAVWLIIGVPANFNVPGHISRWFVLAGLVASTALAMNVVLPRNQLSILLSSFSANATPPLPGNVAIIGLMILIWYRGISLTTALFTPARTGFLFRLGLLLLVAITPINSARLQADLITFIPVFFAAGLIASMLARQASLRTNREVQRSVFGRRWIGFGALLALIITGAGFVVALLLAGYGMEGAGGAIKGALLALSILLSLVLIPFLIVIQQVISWVLARLSLNGANLNAFQNQVNQLMGGPTKTVDVRQYAVIFNALKYVCIGAVVLVVVVVIFSMLRDRENSRTVEGEERERLEHEENSEDREGSLLKWLGGLFGANRARNPADDARTIRRLYAQLIASAAALGYPRQIDQTPFEYQPKLADAFPNFAHEIDMVTWAYVNVHYGELPDNPGEVAAVQAAVERMIASVEQPRRSRRASV